MIEEKDSLSINPDNPKPGFFYGYIVVLASSFIMLIVFGMRFSYGVFFKPIADEFGWSSTAISSVYSLSTIIEGLTGIFMGRLTDKLGPRKILVFCGLTLGLGLLLTSRADTLWQMYLFYGVIIGIGMSGVFVPLVATTARWFISRRSTMIGIVLATAGLSALIGAPLANWLISTYDWRNSYLIFAVTVTIGVLLATPFLKRDPAQIGQSPYSNSQSIEKKSKLYTRDFTFNEVLRTRQFWQAITASFSLGFYLLAIQVHMVPYAIGEGIPASTAATALATIGGFTVIGRLSMGFIADRIGTKPAYFINFIICGVSLVWLLFTDEVWGLFLFSAIFGFGQGGVGLLQAPIATDLFGLKSYGVILGVCGFCATTGGAAGPLLTGYLFDSTGGYQIAFIVCLTICIVGAIAVSLLTPVKEKNLI